MRRTLLALALLGFAGAAGAQTLPSEELTNIAAHGGATHTAQVRELILRAGYSDVEEPKRLEDGTWQAVAVREERRVTVKVDKEGNVAP
jgi:hypothetical protein